MKTDSKNTNKQSKREEPFYSKEFLLKQRIETELYSISSHLKKAHEWIPILKETESPIKPGEIIKSMRKRHNELLKELELISKEEFIESGGRGIGIQSKFKVDPLKLAEYQMTLAELKKHQKVSDFNTIHFGPPDNSPEPWTSVIHSFRFTEYPDFKWNTDDCRAMFYSEWDFSLQPHTAVMGHIGKVMAPPYEGSRKDFPQAAQLIKFGVFAFDVPPSSYNAIVNFNTIVIYVVQQRFNAPYRWFNGSPMLYVQPDANVGSPSRFEDFESVGRSYSIRGGSGESIPFPPFRSDISGNVRVEAGKTCRIHIGMYWNLYMENGYGGTIPGSFDQLVFCPPDDGDFFGVRVNVFPE